MNYELGQALALVRVYDRIDEMRRAAGANAPRAASRRRSSAGPPTMTRAIATTALLAMASVSLWTLRVA